MAGTDGRKDKSQRDLEWALACAGQKSHRRTLYLSLHTTGNHWEIFEQRILGNVRDSKGLTSTFIKLS